MYNMDEHLVELAKKCGGLVFPSMRGDGAWMFLEPDLERFVTHLKQEQEHRIHTLEMQLNTAQTQNDIYRRALKD